LGAQPRILLDAGDIVGESILYDDRRDALLWVDICGRRIHRLALSTGRHETWPTPEFPTSIGLRRDGGAVVGLTKRVALWDYVGSFRSLAFIEPDLPGNRLNEGGVAPDGSFWVGTMQSNLTEAGAPKEMTANSGALYRIDPDGDVTQLTAAEYGITNTLAWTTDGRLLTADTLANIIYQFDHASAGALSNRRIFAAGLARGYPDGSTLDAEGYLWNCRVAGGACLARYAPDGTLDRLVDLPCSWPTSCTFGGKDLSTLFVTSARFTMTAAHLATNPQEGALFALDLGFKGHPARRFGH
jgi:sugar lactone lactonase YvrE